MNYYLPIFTLSVFLSALCLKAESVKLDISSVVGARQQYGEMRINQSVDGNPLKIAGKTYTSGIGSHATSMLPLKVNGKSIFSGTVGIDDETDGSGDGVEFRILGGSSILWSSGRIKKGTAKDFNIKLPLGTNTIYLMAVAGQNNTGDHANWVNLDLSQDNAKTSNRIKISGEEFDLQPGRKDATKALCNALNKLRASGGILELQKGEYHFYKETALEMSFYISNHDQPIIHPVQIPLVDLNNVKINGNGSTFIFHGQSLAVLFMDSNNVTLNNVRIDYERPIYSEAKVVGFDNGKTIVTIDKKAFPYEIRNNHIRFIGEGWTRGSNSIIAFRKDSHQIVERTSDIGFGGRTDFLADGKLAFHKDFRKDGAGIAVGDTLTIRTWDRPHPACVIYRSKRTVLRDVSIHSSCGMTLLAQRSEDIKIVGSKTALDKTSGMFARPETGRVYSASADATHFSNVKGKILVENSFFSTMMDDAINVHSTCLSVEKVLGEKELRCRFKHWQAVGFEVFMPGDTLRFIKGPTLEQGPEIKIDSVRQLNANEIIITLEKDIPAGFGAGDAIENADYQCAVLFRGNHVQNNRARGSLFTTPKKVIIENNTFQNVAGSAILLAGDAQGWYESGPCEDIVIRKNKFINNLTSRFQFTNAIISIYPEVKQLRNQKQYYHRNITIEDNEFDTFNVPLIFAISAENLKFINNTIKYNNDFKAWNQPAFQFNRCAKIKIGNNKVQAIGESSFSPSKWTIEKDFKLNMTPASEIDLKN